jgi:hypothetical protein
MAAAPTGCGRRAGGMSRMANSAPTSEQPVDPVEGWNAIAARVSKHTRLDVSAASVIRWSKRKDDPLPIRRWGVGRPRVVADGQEIDAWCDRQWVTTEQGEEERHDSEHPRGEQYLHQPHGGNSRAPGSRRVHSTPSRHPNQGPAVRPAAEGPGVDHRDRADDPANAFPCRPRAAQDSSERGPSR